ncbi:MAG: hypothetical protein RMJ98_12745 [Myxococcales bacterium]|nr:hypothetical protein [Polyangiaceae bacterium]MDW8250154.1 hypothetical protein [Myxococcales bacterium]
MTILFGYLRRSFLLVACLLGASCENPSSSSGFTPYTAIYIEPADFRGGVLCSDTEGSMQSYVATLYDVSSNDPDNVVTVASSPPLPCSAPAIFSQVIPGHFYIATLDAYQEPACAFGRYEPAGCLVPAGGWGSGVRTQLVSTGIGVPPTSAYASPAWMTHCGRLASTGETGKGEEEGGKAGADDKGSTEETGAGGQRGPFYRYDPKGPTEAVYRTSARMGGCEPLPAPMGPARVVIRAEALRGQFSCGQESGKIARFEVIGSGEAPRLVDCGAEAWFKELPPGQSFEIQVFAFEQGSSGPRWGSRCSARTFAGQTSAARCDPLSERGSLRLLGAVLCEDASTYRATVVGLLNSSALTACPADLVLPDLPAGLLDVTIERRDSAGTLLDGALCTGKVQPGQQTTATCSW